MSLPLLDICDSNLQLWQADKPLNSPGYALLDGGQYTFGNPARSAARLRPRDINTRFWWQLNTEPLQPALGPARHSADMVHAHLLDIHQKAGEPDELLLAVSGSMHRNQLALLLGIIQACPFNAVGLVNRSVALASLHGGAGRLFHLEIQLHQAVWTELTRTGDMLELHRTTPLPGCGLLQLQERLVEVIAAAFIRQTRFDPRRKADSEQRLYDGLPEALRALGDAAEHNLEVNGYRARIIRRDLLAAGERLFEGMTEAMGTPAADDRLLLDPIAGLLPGLGERFPTGEILPTGTLWEAATRHDERLVQRQEALNFITALPCLEERISPRSPATGPEAVEEEPEAAPVVQQATHLLLGACARPLADRTTLADECELRGKDGQWQLHGTGAAAAQVNGRRYLPGTPLACGDRIEIPGDTVATLIEVLP